MIQPDDPGFGPGFDPGNDPDEAPPSERARVLAFFFVMGLGCVIWIFVALWLWGG